MLSGLPSSQRWEDCLSFPLLTVYEEAGNTCVLSFPWPCFHLEAMVSMLPHWRLRPWIPMERHAAWEETRLVLGEFSPLGPCTIQCPWMRVFGFVQAVRSYTLVSWLFFSERITSLKCFPVLPEGLLAGCRFLFYWCSGLAGVLLSLDRKNRKCFYSYPASVE